MFYYFETVKAQKICGNGHIEKYRRGELLRWGQMMKIFRKFSQLCEYNENQRDIET